MVRGFNLDILQKHLWPGLPNLHAAALICEVQWNSCSFTRKLEKIWKCHITPQNERLKATGLLKLRLEEQKC